MMKRHTEIMFKKWMSKLMQKEICEEYLHIAKAVEKNVIMKIIFYFLLLEPKLTKLCMKFLQRFVLMPNE